MAYTTIDDPTKYFDTTLWTGDGGARTITGLNHKPDLIWTKTRSVGYNHMWSDSSRGFNANSELGSNSTAAEGGLSAETYGYKSGHTADGWTMVDGTDTSDGQEDGNTNQPSVTYVGWTWAANGGSRTTFSASGSQIAGGYQANTTAGFSIVDYTGNATNGATFPHGLGATPVIAIIKDRTNAGDGGGTNWIVVSTAQDGTSDRLYLNGTNTKYDLSGTEFRADFDSSNVTLGTWNNVNASGTHIAYVFTPIQGYSKFGSYEGNANTNGPFVYTGFKPALVITKPTDATGNWNINDSARSPNNVVDERIKINSSGAETDLDSMDFLSNGFKIKADGTAHNQNASSYIYMAFAESPFVSSEGVPTTAR